MRELNLLQSAGIKHTVLPLELSIYLNSFFYFPLAKVQWTAHWVHRTNGRWVYKKSQFTYRTSSNSIRSARQSLAAFTALAVYNWQRSSTCREEQLFSKLILFKLYFIFFLKYRLFASFLVGYSFQMVLVSWKHRTEGKYA